MVDITKMPWRCRACAEFFGAPYRNPEHPDVVCGNCGEALPAAERMLEIKYYLARRDAGVAVSAPDGVPSPEERSPGTPGSAADGPRVPQLDGRPVVPIEEAASIIGCGRTKAFALIKSGKLKRAPSPGRRTMVSTASLLRFLQGARRPPRGRDAAGAKNTSPARRTVSKPELRAGSLAKAISEIPIDD